MSTWTWQLHEIFCVALLVWPMPDSPVLICLLLLWYLSSSRLMNYSSNWSCCKSVFSCVLAGTCSWKLLLNVFLLLWGNLCVEVSMNVVNLVRDISELVCLWRDYLHAWRCNCTVIGTGIKLIIFFKKILVHNCGLLNV